DHHHIRVLPVASAAGRPSGLVTLAALGGIFIPRVSQPRLMRQVHTSLASIARALKARVLHLVAEEKAEDFYVRVGTMDIRSFWTISERENIAARESIVIVGDRRDIQRRSIELGIRALIITSGLNVDADIAAQAKAAGVSIIISPYDSTTTGWLVRTASSIERVIDRNFVTVAADTRLVDVRKKFTVATHALLVTNDEGRLIG